MLLTIVIGRHFWQLTLLAISVMHLLVDIMHVKNTPVVSRDVLGELYGKTSFHFCDFDVVQIQMNALPVLVHTSVKILLEVSVVDVLMDTSCWMMVGHALQPMVGCS